jgi:hypothetical protein
MTQLERNKVILKKYIPEKSVDIIADWIYKYNFKLKIKKPRASKIGDHMPPHSGKNHTITVNSDLNKYSFFVTLVHEIAHLITWDKYKGKVFAHGAEWKTEYSKLLNHFLIMNSTLTEEEKLFPNDVYSALKIHVLNPAAASCSDIQLARVLDKYDVDKNCLTLERIAIGSSFRIVETKNKFSKDIFIKVEKRRTRFKCVHAHNKREYLIHALCKVMLI